MDNDRSVSLTITLPKHYRDILRRKSAKWTLGHQDEGISAARLARDIIREYLHDWESNKEEKAAKVP